MYRRRVLWSLTTLLAVLVVSGSVAIAPSGTVLGSPAANGPAHSARGEPWRDAGPPAGSVASIGTDETAALTWAPYARRALSVEGEYDALHVANQADLNPRTAITLELWLKHRQPHGCATLIGKGRASSYWLGICDGKLRFEIASRLVVESSAIIPEGRWTHVAVTYAQPAARLYINGQADQEILNARIGLTLNDADLVLGADALPGTGLRGLVDHARLWSVVRPLPDIRDNLFTALSAQAGLVAQWELNGNGDDAVGGHNGWIPSGGAFSFDGAVPRDATVPLSSAAVNVDGRCDAAEYGLAQRVAADIPDAPPILLQASQSDLYLCFARMTRPRSGNGLTQVYLDRDLSRDEKAQTNDYRFGVNQRNIAESKQGDGAGGWRDLTLPTGSWQAVQVSDQDAWSAEYRIPRNLIDRPADPEEPYRFGLALMMTSDMPTTGDYPWPVNATAAGPNTWSVATLAQRAGDLPYARFSGRVAYELADGRLEGIPNATVQLFGADESALWLYATATTDGGGQYALEYRGQWPESFLVRELDARGSLSVRSEPGSRGESASENLLQYPIDAGNDQAQVIVTDGLFVDRVGQAAPSTLLQRYLIVYSAPVSEPDLWPIVFAKQQQGFQVVTTSTQDLERTGEGRDLAERIHNWLKGQWEEADGAAVYALLVGRGDKIPVRDVGWLDNDHRDPSASTYYPAWPTDWYYADLDSEWDSDQDGFFGEFMQCRPGDKYPDPEGEKVCPEMGSLMREGPFGAYRSPDDDYQPEISVGRIAVNEPGEVRRALSASAAAEMVGGPDKHRALLAGSFYTFEGRSWSSAAGGYVVGGSPDADPWVGMPWAGQRPLGADSADFLDSELWPLVEPFMSQVTRLYESTVPSTGFEYPVPTLRQPDGALTPDSFAQAWSEGRFALVDVAGRGGPEGVVGVRWAYDWDLDMIVDQPASPSTCTGDRIDPLGQVGPPCWELIAEPFVNVQLPAPAGPPPVVFATTGRTGAIGWSWRAMDRSNNVLALTYGPPALAGTLPGRGRAAAFVGTLVDVPPGLLDGFETSANGYLLATPLRLGDAVWRANAELAAAEPFDIRSYGVELFGDPAMTYWGNPADMAGAWPQDGRDWRAAGASPYSGPAVPDRAFSVVDGAPNAPASIGRSGEIVLGGQDSILRFSTGGALLARTMLPGASGATNRYAPAIGVDGVYVAAGSSLYFLDSALSLREQIALPSGAVAGGAPRIASDGAVWVPTNLGMARMTGSGDVALFGNEAAIGPMALLPSGEAVWSTAGDVIATVTIDRTGKLSEGEISQRDMRGLTAAAVAASGTLYVGSSTGRLYALDREGPLWQVDTGSPVTLRPAVGDEGKVYVATSRGVVLAYGPSGGKELWRRDLGAAARSTPTLDGSQLYVTSGTQLYALDLATGNVMWHYDLISQADERSVPVIGGDRTIYLVRTDQSLLALREAGWLSAPSDVRLTPGADSVTVDWRDNSADETGFRVELCEVADRCFLATDVGTNTTRATLRRLPVAPGTPYYARVQAIGLADADQPTAIRGEADPLASRAMSDDTNSSSAFAVSAFAAALSPTPAKVALLRAVATASDVVELSWQYGADPGQLEGFEVRRGARAQGPFSPLGFVGPDEDRFVDRQVQPDTAYYYQVGAINEAGTSEMVGATATTKAQNLRAPSELTAVVSNGTFVLRWQDNASDENGYVVQRRGVGSATYETVGILGANARSFVDVAYLLRGTYHYRVKALGATADSPYALTLGTIGGPTVAWVYMPFAFQRR